MKHTSRLSAEKTFAAASKAMREFNGNSESEFAALEAAFASARDALISAEQAHPTSREVSRRHNNLRLENMGLLT